MSADTATRRRRVFHHSAGAVVIDELSCLLVRRGSEWAFPKGHLEREESAEDAARREVKEETGIDVELLAPLGPTRYEFKSHNGTRNRKLVDWFLARRLGGEIVHEPIFAEARFEPITTARDLLTHAADKALLDRAIERAGLGGDDGADDRADGLAGEGRDGEGLSERDGRG